MRRIAIVAALLAGSASMAGAEILLRAPIPLPPPRIVSPVAWSATVGALADQLHAEGRVHLGAMSVGAGPLSRVGADARVLRYEGITAGVRVEHGAFAIEANWVDLGEHVVTRLVGGTVVADTFLVPPQRVVVRSDPSRGFVLGARFHRAPFALDVRTVARAGADRGALLPGQAVAAWELGRAALLAGFGRPARFGRLGFEPQAFAGVSWSLGSGAVAGSAPPRGPSPEPAAPAFHAFLLGASVRVEIVAPRASRVEVASDANAWEPLALVPAGAGRWEGVMAAGPGALRILMRIDGGSWLPPPGLPVAHDPTTGDVGILILEP